MLCARLQWLLESQKPKPKPREGEANRFELRELLGLLTQAGGLVLFDLVFHASPALSAAYPAAGT